MTFITIQTDAFPFVIAGAISNGHFSLNPPRAPKTLRFSHILNGIPIIQHKTHYWHF